MQVRLWPAVCGSLQQSPSAQHTKPVKKGNLPEVHNLCSSLMYRKSSAIFAVSAMQIKREVAGGGLEA